MELRALVPHVVALAAQQCEGDAALHVVSLAAQQCEGDAAL